jgi:hypothetical protein
MGSVPGAHVNSLKQGEFKRSSPDALLEHLPPERLEPAGSLCALASVMLLWMVAGRLDERARVQRRTARPELRALPDRAPGR